MKFQYYGKTNYGWKEYWFNKMHGILLYRHLQLWDKVIYRHIQQMKRYLGVFV